MLHREEEIIKHMLRYCDEVDRALQKLGRDRETFLNEPVLRNACAMPIMQIGELAKHLPDSFLKEHAHIPWKIIKGMRNLFAHDYISMEAEIIWETATEDIPKLRAELKASQDAMRNQGEI